MSRAARYRGRFAPTPSGPLHAGSLVMALASWLDARANDGEWLLRIDDIDPPRTQPGAADRICWQLERCGLYWDGQVLWQSEHQQRYQAALTRLLDSGGAFYCRLSRRDLQPWGGRHPGRAVAIDHQTAAPATAAVRLDVDDTAICFDDRFQGRQCVSLASDGPFVIRRRDGLFAYQLACAVDDADLGITDVVRGVDLLDSTARQIHVLNALAPSMPRYGHLPVVCDAQGNKLSKSAGSAALDLAAPSEALDQALQWLGLHVTVDTTACMLDQAISAWPTRLKQGW